MSNPRVVCNVGVWLTWVNGLRMDPPLLFEEQLRAPVFGRPWKVNRLSCGSMIFLDTASVLCLVMGTGPLIVRLVLSYSWNDLLTLCRLFLASRSCGRGFGTLQSCWCRAIKTSLVACKG